MSFEVNFNQGRSLPELPKLSKQGEEPNYKNFDYAGLPMKFALGNARRELNRGVRETSTNDSKDIRVYKKGAKNNFNWCAYFVDWCYGKNNLFGLSDADRGRSQKIKDAAHARGLLREKGSGYVPKEGDLVIWSKNKSEGHIGMVSKVNPDGSFETIEGNVGNKVSNCSYSGIAAANRKYEGQHLAGFVDMHTYFEDRLPEHIKSGRESVQEPQVGTRFEALS